MKNAFTLLELMIVIVIMGVVYKLSINSFARLSDESAKVDLKSLKQYLQDVPHKTNAELLCFDDCSKCDVYVDGVKTKSLEDFFDKEVQTYRYDFLYGFIKKEPDVFFDKDDVEQDVCFSYSVGHNGVGDQVLVSYKDKFYDYAPYLSEVLVYNSMSDASNARDELAREVLQ